MKLRSVIWAIGIICSVLPNQVFAQKPKPADFGIKSKKAMNLYLEAEQHARRRERVEAIAKLEEAVKIEPEFLGARYRLGANAYLLNKYEEAIPHLEIVYAQNAAQFHGIGLLLGESYFKTGQYTASIDPFSSFLQSSRGKRADFQRAEVNLRKAKFAQAAIKDTVAFQPQNMGPTINTKRDEYLPFLTADDRFLLFTSRRPEGIGEYDPMLRDYPEDFFSSEYKDGSWQNASNLGPPINTPRNEGAASISQDGKTIFFTACNRVDGYGSCDLYLSERKGNVWTKPENLGPNINTAGWESQPCLSHDGNTLFFTSGRPGGLGKRDLWYSTQEDGIWGPAINMGTPINTPGNEGSPFLHADGKTFYFSSDFHPGFGAKDLFVSRKTTDSWSSPKNLGYPLNTKNEESNIFISANGKRGFINSDRPGGMGKSDLYEFEVDPKIRPELATFLRGSTVDSVTRTPVQAKIRLIDIESGDTIRNVFSGRTDGRFLMSLPLDREYAAIAEASGYVFASKNFYLKEVGEGIYFDLEIALLPIKEGATVTLNNIFFESGDFSVKATSLPEIRVLTRFLQRHPSLSIEIQGHTDDVGSETANKTLSQNRADAVKALLLAAGIEGERVFAKGYGESQPVASNEEEAGRAKNRRTEFVIIGTE